MIVAWKCDYTNRKGRPCRRRARARIWIPSTWIGAENDEHPLYFCWPHYLDHENATRGRGDGIRRSEVLP